MTVNIAHDLALWIAHEITIEARLKIEDLQLLRMGFTYQDAMNLSLLERRQYLELGQKLEILKRYEELFGLADVGTVTNGFGSKSARKRIVRNWKAGVSRTTQELTNVGIPLRKPASTPPKQKRIKPVAFKDKLAQIRSRNANG